MSIPWLLCPVSLCYQAFSNYGSDYKVSINPCRPKETISTACAALVQKIDWKCHDDLTFLTLIPDDKG